MVVTADPGCLLQMRGMAAPDQRVEHVATVLDARAAGLLAALVLLALRAPFLVVVLGSALTAAVLRHLGLMS